jgi:transcriptional antiterminator RfaH
LSNKWYVVRTKPRKEFLAEAELKLGGFEVFCPRVKATQPQTGQSHLALFPGYLFLQFDDETPGLPSFRQSQWIIDFVKFGDVIPSLPDKDIVFLKDCETTNHDGGLFLAGERVLVTSDHFQGLALVVEGNKSSNAGVMVRLAFMGRMVKAQVPLRHLGRMEGRGLREEVTGHKATPKATAPRRTRRRKVWGS